MKKNKPTTNGWEETRQLMNELIRQNVAMAQQNIALGQRLDAQAQRLDAFAARMDRLEERMQRVESNLAVVIDLLHHLPDAVKEKIGFSASGQKT
ncbi:MAG: hypothetical protein HYU36_13805 [Planctomycetes bacterium]|nr:hypothetical protein [Planctomycetota bacterium]